MGTKNKVKATLSLIYKITKPETILGPRRSFPDMENSISSAAIEILSYRHNTLLTYKIELLKNF